MPTIPASKRRGFIRNLFGLAALVLATFMFSTSDIVALAFGAGAGYLFGIMLAGVGGAGMGAMVAFDSVRAGTAMLAVGSVALAAFVTAVATVGAGA